MTGQTPKVAACGCPETGGKIYHQRGTCPDPVVAKLDWYADAGRIAAAPTPEQAAFEAFQASRAKRHPMMPVTAWTHPAVDDARPDWKAAAQAVLNDAFPGLRAQIREARDDRDDYAARLKAVDASWAVLAAERDDLAEQLDKLRQQHKQLLDDFVSNGSGYTRRLSDFDLAHQYADAGMPVPDRFSHLAGQ